MRTERIERLDERDEIARNQPSALMNELIERMLAIRARLAPVDRSGGVIDNIAIERDSLAIAFHRELLQVGWESLEILVIWQHRDRFSTEEVRVPNRE